ncbi:putative nuclease HARBI1 [Copidosoma floridanum]|uniref:putative nuclease HARBI1 n=1 Tax=Copidosoma floridanum TaxID=29053 RepID=UPI0006C95B7C|nr:putative nuclease HARBI1 [Copidosoma floridanum]
MSSVKIKSNKKTQERQSDWWDDFVKGNYNNEQCLKHLKCSRKTYLFLVNFLMPYTKPKIGASNDNDIYLRKGVEVEKQVAVLLFKLTTNADYITISKKFKIHKTTIHKIIYKCVTALNKYLLHDVISMPKKEEVEFMAKDYECSYKIPQIIGTMTIVHIPISSPLLLNYQFLNARLYASFVLQSVVDSNNFFRDVSVRHAGAAELHTVLADSNIYKYWKKVIPPAKSNFNGTNVSYKIVGPAQGPLFSWLLNNYSPPATISDLFFNTKLEEIRAHANSVITRLRSRFSILSQPMDLSYKVAPQIIAVCCIIHNICEKNNDIFLEEWQDECKAFLKKYPQPGMNAEWEQPSDKVREERDALRDYANNQDNNAEPTEDLLEAALNAAILDSVDDVTHFDSILH